MSRNAVLLAVGAVLVVVVGIWLWSQSQKGQVTTTSYPPQSLPTQQPATSGAQQTSEVREIEVSGDEFSFTPDALSLREGERVRIVFTNAGKFPHNLTISELGVSTKTINTGQKDTVEFTVNRTGSFTMFCSASNHRAQGMEGKVEVN